MNKQKFRILFPMLFIIGCATHPIAMNYAPSSLLTSGGSIQINNFIYKPFIDKKVKENEIRTTAIGYFEIESPISTLISNAIKLELKFMGTKLDNSSNKILTGEIEEFLVDDLGFSVDVTLKIKYKTEVDNKVCTTTEIVTKKNGAKFINATGLVSDTIKSNIENLAQDDNFSSCLLSLKKQ
ncbi:MAG: hypothetical protein HOP07_01285 [Bacteriovoracaceae bacterium]|nr:hypothetical protein [Bacteriovoracaceae bacterium]